MFETQFHDPTPSRWVSITEHLKLLRGKPVRDILLQGPVRYESGGLIDSELRLSV